MLLKIDVSVNKRQPFALCFYDFLKVNSNNKYIFVKNEILYLISKQSE